MRTNHVDILLPEYAGGLLDKPQADAVEDHLRVCESCRTQLAELRETLALLEQSKSKDLPRFYLPTVLPNVRERLEHREKKSWISAPVLNRVLLPLGAAALFFIVGIRLSSVWQMGESEDPLQAAVSASSADDIARVLQEDVPSQDAGLLNTSILSRALSDDNFVREKILSEALNSESTSPFAVFADVSPQQVLDDLKDTYADALLQRLQKMENL